MWYTSKKDSLWEWSILFRVGVPIYCFGWLSYSIRVWSTPELHSENPIILPALTFILILLCTVLELWEWVQIRILKHSYNLTGSFHPRIVRILMRVEFVLWLLPAISLFVHEKYYVLAYWLISLVAMVGNQSALYSHILSTKETPPSNESQ